MRNAQERPFRKQIGACVYHITLVMVTIPRGKTVKSEREITSGNVSLTRGIQDLGLRYEYVHPPVWLPGQAQLLAKLSFVCSTIWATVGHPEMSVRLPFL